MNCQELTTFLQRVLDKRELIFEPKNNQIEDILNFQREFEKVYQLFEPHNVGLRLELSQGLNLSYVGAFYDGWAVAYRKNFGRTYINKSGEFIKDENDEELWFAQVDRFYEGMAVVVTKDFELYFLRTDGKKIPESGSFVQNSDDLSQFRFSRGYGQALQGSSHLRYVNREGIFADKLNRKTDQAYPFSMEGLAKIEHREVVTGKADFGFMDTDGKMLVTENGIEFFDDAVEFSEGYAWVYVELDSGQKEWLIIDTAGKYMRKNTDEAISVPESPFIITIPNSPFPFHNGWSRFEAGGITNSAYGYINAKGEELQSEDGFRLFGSALDFSEGYASAGGRFIDTDGKYLRNEKGDIIEYEHTQSFEDGLAIVRKAGESNIHFMDHQGRLVDFGK